MAPASVDFETLDALKAEVQEALSELQQQLNEMAMDHACDIRVVCIRAQLCEPEQCIRLLHLIHATVSQCAGILFLAESKLVGATQSSLATTPISLLHQAVQTLGVPVPIIALAPPPLAYQQTAHDDALRLSLYEATCATSRGDPTIPSSPLSLVQAGAKYVLSEASV